MLTSQLGQGYCSRWLLMWPLYLLLNKFLGAEAENGQGSDGSHLNVIDGYAFGQLSISEKCDNSVLPHSHFVAVPHINQQHNWDCGLACILMVLETLGIGNCIIQDLVELCCTTSIWTVDLAYVLQKYSVNFSYFTVTFGANPNFNVETFYKDQLPNDLVRVDTLFQKAVEAGLYSDSSGYAGHYVVICGYDAETMEFEIRDPASSRKHEKVTVERLQEARKSFGTDEDLLLISLERGIEI